MKVHYQLLKYKEDKGLIRKTRKFISRSFVKQFMLLLYARLNQTTYSTLDIDGNSRNPLQYSSLCCAHSGQESYASFGTLSYQYQGSNILGDCVGIVIGTGTSAVGITNYALVTPINHGTGTGEMEYLSCSGTTTTVAAPSASFTIERYFRNSSGGTITITELGLYATAATTPGSGWKFIYSHCIIRDLLSSSVDVLDGEYLKIIYTFTITA